MQKLYFASYLLIILAFGLFDTCRADIEMSISQRVDGDEELQSADLIIRGYPSSPFTFVKTLTGDGLSLITQMTVDRISRDGSFVALVYGGPGKTFATVQVAVWPKANIEYKVKLYGKKKLAYFIGR